MSDDDFFCPHKIDRRTARCTLCLDPAALTAAARPLICPPVEVVVRGSCITEPIFKTRHHETPFRKLTLIEEIKEWLKYYPADGDPDLVQHTLADYRRSHDLLRFAAAKLSTQDLATEITDFLKHEENTRCQECQRWTVLDVVEKSGPHCPTCGAGTLQTSSSGELTWRS